MITKSVIPAAGFGTRMLPAAKSVPKEMLPILDRPTIQYVVEESAQARATDVLLVVSREKKAIEDHFDRAVELEQRLIASGKSEFLASVAMVMAQVQVHSVRQREQLGLGHAVLQAKAHVGHDSFLCLLGDTIFSGGTPPAVQLAAAHQRLGGSIIGLERVPKDRVSRYGVVGGDMLDPATIRISTLVEKPKPHEAPSDLAIAARYLFSPSIFGCIERTGRGAGGEIQLTDAIKLLARDEPVHGVILESRRHDIGNPADWLLTNLTFARHNPELWDKLQPALRALLT
jgi:UTP--glucose-1-phosphate uridylyltransferase